MTLSKDFDYDDYMREFRAACARRGIDPARGANGYEVVHVIAEQRRAMRSPDRWWQRHELWLNCPPYVSETEREAIWNVFMQAYALTALLIARALCRRHRRRALTPPPLAALASPPRIQGGENAKKRSPIE